MWMDIFEILRMLAGDCLRFLARVQVWNLPVGIGTECVVPVKGVEFGSMCGILFEVSTGFPIGRCNQWLVIVSLARYRSFTIDVTDRMALFLLIKKNPSNHQIIWLGFGHFPLWRIRLSAENPPRISQNLSRIFKNLQGSPRIFKNPPRISQESLENPPRISKHPLIIPKNPQESQKILLETRSTPPPLQVLSYENPNQSFRNLEHPSASSSSSRESLIISEDRAAELSSGFFLFPIVGGGIYEDRRVFEVSLSSGRTH